MGTNRFSIGLGMQFSAKFSPAAGKGELQQRLSSGLFSAQIPLHDGRVALVQESVLPELPPILTADSITRVGTEAVGAVVVNGSHGGIYAAYLAGKLRAAAAIFNDAGVGRDQAGIAGVDYLERFGIPTAAIGHDSARIGD